MSVIIFLHGYSGGPGNYFGLDTILAEKTNQQVINPYLPGHGTDVKFLVPLHYNDFYEYAYLLINQYKNDDITLVGYSLGGQLALILASQFNIKKLVLFSVPFKVKFPFNILPFPRFLQQKLIDKPEDQHKEGQGYPRVPGKGIPILRKANRIIKECVGKITCPILYVEGKQDPGISSKNIPGLQRYLGNTQIEVKHINKNFDPHNVLSPKPSPEIVDAIVEFIQRK